MSSGSLGCPSGSRDLDRAPSGSINYSQDCSLNSGAKLTLQARFKVLSSKKKQSRANEFYG